MNVRKPVDYSTMYRELAAILAQNLPQMDEIHASSIIAMQYTEQTVENGKVKRISPHLAPDKFGVSFSENYHSDELPIWRFYIQPSE